MEAENDLSALPEGVFDNTSNLYNLSLSHNGLSALPEGVFDNLSNLEWLSLEANDLTALSDGGHLRQHLQPGVAEPD